MQSFPRFTKQKECNKMNNIINKMLSYIKDLKPS